MYNGGNLPLLVITVTATTVVNERCNISSRYEECGWSGRVEGETEDVSTHANQFCLYLKKSRAFLMLIFLKFTNTEARDVSDGLYQISPKSDSKYRKCACELIYTHK
jgi:hypothetical protein